MRYSPSAIKERLQIAMSPIKARRIHRILKENKKYKLEAEGAKFKHPNSKQFLKARIELKPLKRVPRFIDKKYTHGSISADRLWETISPEKLPYTPSKITAEEIPTGVLKGRENEFVYNFSDKYIGMTPKSLDNEDVHETWEIPYDVGTTYSGHGLKDSDKLKYSTLRILSHELGHHAGAKDRLEEIEDNSADYRSMNTIPEKIKNIFKHYMDRSNRHYYTDFSSEFNTGLFNAIASARVLTGDPLDTPERIYDYLTFLENNKKYLNLYKKAPDGGRLFRTLYHLNQKHSKTAEKLKRAIAFQGALI